MRKLWAPTLLESRCGLLRVLPRAHRLRSGRPRGSARDAQGEPRCGCGPVVTFPFATDSLGLLASRIGSPLERGESGKVAHDQNGESARASVGHRTRWDRAALKAMRTLEVQNE